MATSDKYDRQLRLWGAAGQKALGDTCVVLIRASAAGTETLKNLVLPGIGSALVVDDVLSSPSGTDFASNFFLTKTEPEDSRPRAQVAMEHLQELNPDVKGKWKHVDSLSTVDFRSLLSEVTSSSTKVLVVASDLEPPILEAVAVACQDGHFPLVMVQSYGLLGVVRLQTPPLPLMNPKPRDARPDLRLTNPFVKLQEMADSIPWRELENHEHAHVPYPLILLRLAKEWKENHNGKLPTQFAEKQEFQEGIKQASRDFNMELNFQEAQKNAYLAYAEQELDLDHLATLRDRSAFSAPTLHTLLHALHQFLQRHANQPPLQGTIPDMTASTQRYVQLQAIYKHQADADLAEMRALLNDAAISDEELVTFCQNIYLLDLFEPRTIVEEYHGPLSSEMGEDLAMATLEGDERPDQLCLLWYLGLQACRFFFNKAERYPGVLDEHLQDVPLLQECLLEVVKHYGLSECELVQETLVEKAADYATELARYGNAEIHSIASVIGGVASQEAVKLITGQYVPIDNCYVYNGIASIGGVYKF